MGVIDDVRKAMQDVVAPDLKALAAEIKALDKKIDMRTDALDKKIDMRTDALDKKIDMRADALDEKIDLVRDLILAELRSMQTTMQAEFARMNHAIDMDRRLEKLESERSATPRSPLAKRHLGLHRS